MNPEDEEAAERLRSEPSYVGTTRTTCVVTMLEAGHAENALPQSATATVNCRIFPGVSVEDIERELRNVVGNEEAEFVLLGEPDGKPDFRASRRRSRSLVQSRAWPLSGTST
jgi:carboxypeptidase PM20D1